MNSRVWLFVMFARVNRVFPPCRKARTARNHAEVAARICVWLQRWDVSDESRRMWAARTVLDGASCIGLPPEYVPCGHGSCRRNARDQGGIEGQALVRLAEMLLDDPYPTREVDLRAWETLFPATAALTMAGTAGGPECLRIIEQERIEAAIGEWELLPDVSPAEMLDSDVHVRAVEYGAQDVEPVFDGSAWLWPAHDDLAIDKISYHAGDDTFSGWSVGANVPEWTQR